MNLKIKVRWYFFLVLVTMVFAALSVFGQSCCGLPSQALVKDTEPNDPGKTPDTPGKSSAPDFTVSTLEGGTFNLYNQRGKPVVLYIMASWYASFIGEAD